MFGTLLQTTQNSLANLHKILTEADTILIGAGAGLSVSAGFTYSGQRFYRYFSDFAQKYGFQDMYSGGFYAFASLEEYWAYWSRYIYINRYTDAPKPVYQKLYELVKGKDYFVLTTNVDHCFQKSGFDKNRLFYTQGDYGLFQCSVPCCQKTYDNETSVRQMLAQQKEMKIPSALLPICPICGQPLTMNLRADNTFVEDEGWHRAAQRYADFLQEHRQAKLLLLELGIGMNTPNIIKFNFWRMTHQWSNAFYACINLNKASVPKEIRTNSICLNEDIDFILDNLLSYQRMVTK